MNRSSDTQEVKFALRGRILDLCRRLLPDGQRKGRLWVAHNPVTMDHRQSPEFKVALDRDIGAWIDYRTGEKGDVIRLIEYTMRLEFREAMDFARDFCGMRAMSSEQRQKLQRDTRQAQQEADRNTEKLRLKRMADAERIWHEGRADGAGSTGEAFAQRYFAARSIPLERIPNRDRATFRFATHQEFWPRAQYRHENGRRIKVQAGPEYPAVLSAMRLPTGQVSAVHMTFLDPLGPRKLPVSGDENAKVMFGEAKGAVISISFGPENQPMDTALEPHPLVIGEGIETTMSVAVVAPQARCVAAGSLSNMANVPFWLPCISSIVLLRDQFKSKTTEKQWLKVLEAAAASGKPVVEMDSHDGNDFNDLMKGE